MKTKFKFILLASALLLSIAALKVWSSAGEFQPGTSLGTWSLGGLTREEALGRIPIAAEQREVRVDGKKIDVLLRPKAAQGIGSAWRKNSPSLLDRILGSGGGHTALLWQYSKKDYQKVYRLALGEARDAREARITWRGDRIFFVPGKNGWKINQKQLARNIRQTLRFGGGALQVPGSILRPEILTAKQYWKKYPTQLLVDQSDFKLYRYRRGKLLRSYPVAVGMPGFETPNGMWKILDRTEDPAWLPPDWAGEAAGVLVPGGSPDNPLVSRWMGIGDGVGIHGTRDTASLGSAASHGCIRMDPMQVQELYPHVPLGTPMLIRE